MLNRALRKSRVFSKQHDCEAFEEMIAEAKEGGAKVRCQAMSMTRLFR